MGYFVKRSSYNPDKQLSPHGHLPHSSLAPLCFAPPPSWPPSPPPHAAAPPVPRPMPLNRPIPCRRVPNAALPPSPATAYCESTTAKVEIFCQIHRHRLASPCLVAGSASRDNRSALRRRGEAPSFHPRSHRRHRSTERRWQARGTRCAARRPSSRSAAAPGTYPHHRRRSRIHQPAVCNRLYGSFCETGFYPIHREGS